MLLPVFPSPRVLGALQRVLLVALLAPGMLVAVIAAVPALLVLPFVTGGTERCIKLLSAYTKYARTLLTGSRPAP